MKTFETEKHNIPEGATHYINESCVHRFSWGKYVGDDLHLRLSGDEGWTCVENKFFSGVVDEIPQEENQMNIDNLATQTPEEKEALDLIDTTPHQYESVASKDVEWVNGDECDVWSSCEWHSGEHTFIGLSKCKSKYVVCYNYLTNYVEFPMESVRKPESPQQREERERLEAAYDLYCTGNKGLNVTAPCTFDAFESDEIQCKFWPAIVDKTNYRKESN